MTTDWAHLITPASLMSDFDPGSLSRGSSYAKQRRINAVNWDDPKHRLTGRCVGSGISTYDVDVVFSSLGIDWKIADASCTCPVGYFCKHAVALLLTFAQEAGLPGSPAGQVPQWDRRLRPLLSENRPKPSEPLALQVFYSEGVTRGRRPKPSQLALRPLRPGTRTPWIRSGIDWPTIVGLAPERFETDQVSVLQAMARDAMRTIRFGLPYGLILTTAPPTIWRHLEAAVAAGIPILGDGAAGIDTVQIGKRAGLTLDIVGGEIGDDARVEVEIDVDGVALPSGGAEILGSAAPHGISYIDDDGLLTLAPFDPDNGAIAQLLDGPPIVIPAADAAAFAEEMLPRLRESVPVRVDETVFTPPVITGPVAVLTVRIIHDVAHTHWAMRYLVNGTVKDFDDLSGTGLLWRDMSAEHHLWEGLRGVMGSVASISQDATIGTLRRDLQLTPVETARLFAEILPDLAGRDDLVLDIAEVNAHYRPVTEPAQLRFSTAGTGESDWLDLAITMDVDGEQVPVAEVLAELSTGATHMLLPSGVYFPLDTPELTKLRELMTEAETLGELDFGRVPSVPANVTLWEELLQLGVVDEQLGQWQERVQKLSAARPPEHIEPPSTLHATLRDYQRDGLNWLSFLWDNGLGGVLADDMGLGKTLQTLALFARARENGETGTFLVVAPTSVVGNWASECHRFTDLKAVTVAATQARSRTSLAEQIADADVVITTYALLRIDFDTYDDLPWAALLLDEAQFVKNHNSKAHQCARRLKVPFKLAITGTPMENNLMELWSLLSITVPGLFPSPRTFTEFFRRPIEKGENPERLPVLRKRIKPVMLRRTKDQVARDLPAKQEQVMQVELSPRHRKIYDTRLVREREVVLGLLGDWEKNRFQIFRSLTMLRQLSLHAGLVDPVDNDVASAKVEFIREQLPELIAEGHSALVFSQFTGFLRILRKSLEADGIPYSYLDGSLSAKDRTVAIEKFTSGETQVFLISLKAGGFGLNLTEADYCFVCDPWWNPAAEAQAIDRTHRIGQTRPVTVYRLVSADTIEAKVVDLQERKRALFNAVIDDGEMFSTAVEADDIRKMLE
ncbi:DEAD/DEAH box helicase [Nocardia sp. 348MFTsu5.1]|uniref:DEAD/DEAH box helicase n=1 Tax=Nocardia sp. 348MFTsu5.1 TaxID=1172185 RepID=UPI00035E4FCC|nr:DEAD/DEAH box helicase [Nocardia sp. 348MFTsu5.1]